LGMGDGGLGIGHSAQSPIPKPQSPIPNPQLLDKKIKILLNKNFFKNLNSNKKIIYILH